MNDTEALIWGIIIIAAIAAFVIGGFVALTGAWSGTFAHGAALRESMRQQSTKGRAKQ